MTSDPTALPVPWPDLQRALRGDQGKLRDIVVRSSDDADWQAALDYTKRLAAGGTARLESQPDPLPASITDVFDLRETGHASMQLFVGDVQVNCHFFGNLIEFDFDAREVATVDAAAPLLRFVEGLAHSVELPASITEVDWPDRAWFTFDPASGAWVQGPWFQSDSASRLTKGVLGRLFARVRRT